MLFSQVFLSLVASVSAIDIWLNWSATDCHGQNSIKCADINPDTCCTVNGVTGSPFGSLHFKEIPAHWNIDCRGHQGTNCGRVIERVNSNGRTDVCLGHGSLGGGGYGFANKRGITTDIKCRDIVKPNVVAFADGTQYNLAELDDASFDEMVCTFASKVLI